MRLSRLIAPTAAALIAAGAGGTAASAFFADGSRTGGNSAASGTIALGADGFVKSGTTVEPLATVSAIRPDGVEHTGDPRSLVNAGSAPATLRVRPEATATATQLASRLEVRVQRCSDSACATVLGTSAWTPATAGTNLPLGTVAPGATTHLKFFVRWPAGTGQEAFYGQSTSLPVRINLLSASTPASA